MHGVYRIRILDQLGVVCMVYVIMLSSRAFVYSVTIKTNIMYSVDTTRWKQLFLLLRTNQAQ